MSDSSDALSHGSEHSSRTQTSTALRAHSSTEVSKKIDEKSVRDALAHHTRGKIEWGTPAGFIDVFTQDEIIEIKHYKNWKNGVGQLMAYGVYYPVHKKRLHLFAREGERALKYFEMATKLCVKKGIRVTFEQVVTSNDVGVNVVEGTEVFALIETPEPRMASCATPTPLPTTMAELMEWHKLQLENPRENAEGCLRRLRKKAVSAENSGAMSAENTSDIAEAPRVSDNSGKIMGLGDESTTVTDTKAGEKRKKGEHLLVSTRRDTGQKKQMTPAMRLRADLLREMHPIFVRVAREVWSEEPDALRFVTVDGKKTNSVGYLLKKARKTPTSLLEDRVKEKLMSAEPNFCQKFYEEFPIKSGSKRAMRYPLELDSSCWPEWIED